MMPTGRPIPLTGLAVGIAVALVVDGNGDVDVCLALSTRPPSDK
jgi:hypothetical protein